MEKNPILYVTFKVAMFLCLYVAARATNLGRHFDTNTVMQIIHRFFSRGVKQT